LVFAKNSEAPVIIITSFADETTYINTKTLIQILFPSKIIIPHKRSLEEYVEKYNSKLNILLPK
jgi:hypothetical protein